MRRFLAGAALGLLAGLVVGVAGGSQLIVEGSGKGAGRLRGQERATPSAGDPQAARHERTGDDQPLPSDSAADADRRGRVTRPEPVKRETPEEAPPETPKRPTADLLHDLESALGGDAPLEPALSDLAGSVVSRSDRDPLPFALILAALDRASNRLDEGVEVAAMLIPGISLEDAVTALRAAIAGDEKLLWVASDLASRATSDDSLDFTALSTELLASASVDGRAAGVYLSQWADPPPVRALLRAAESDPDDETRAYALDIVTDLAEDSDDPVIRELIVPLVLVTALQGEAESRRSAIEMFEEIGPPAAGASLTLLREGGLDEDLAYYVVRPLLDSGRIDDIMRTDVTEEIADSIVWWADEGDEDTDEDATRVELILPHAARLLPLCGEDAAGSLVYMLLYHGHLAALEEIALGDELDRETATTLLESFFSVDTVPEEQQPELESRGLRVLAAYLDPKTSGVERRRRTARAASWGGLSFSSERCRLATIAMLENTVRADPNSWVRGFAREAVEVLRDEIE